MFEYHQILSRFYNQALLLSPAKAEIVSGFLLSRIAAGRGGRMGEQSSAQTFEGFPSKVRQDGTIEFHSTRAGRFVGVTPIGADGRPMPFRRTEQGVGIITVVGELVNRGAWIGASSGLISYEGIKAQLAAAANDPQTKAILLDLESPGGEAVGAFEIAAAVRATAAVKPVVAVVDGMAASAAYAIASGASQIVTIPTGLVGSIGVVMMHLDISKALETEGIRPTLIFAGAHKVDGNPFEPLPDAVRARFEAEIGSFYAQFVETVVAGRKSMTAAAVRGTEAQIFKGQDAVDAGLADAVGTFDDVLAELSGGSTGRSMSAAMKGTAMQTNMGAPAAIAGNLEGTTALASITTLAGLTAAFPTLVAEARAEGAAAERERIAGIEANAMPGHEDVIAAAKADPTCTPDQAAARVLKAENAARAGQLGRLDNVEREANRIAPAPAASVGGTPAAETANTPEGWKAEYAASAKLQGEFAAVEDYVAYKQADAAGKVKVLGRK